MKPPGNPHRLRPAHWAASVAIVSLVAYLGFMYRETKGFRFARGNGDVGAFILEQAVAATGHPVKTNGFLTLTHPWRYARDRFGVVVRLHHSDYPFAEAFLREAFSTMPWRTQTVAGAGQMNFLRLSDQGGALSLTDSPDSAEVIVLRPVTTQEFKGELSDLLKPSLPRRLWGRVMNVVHLFI
ncbi:MAG TPA: hypothetical protein VMF06_25350 [Candidatus Limnocylindria bacterium]|jgi:hypothetical protein|nr:hypothetical protein [Candidatus Limnocylindria bacterium]